MAFPFPSYIVRFNSIDFQARLGKAPMDKWVFHKAEC